MNLRPESIDEVFRATELHFPKDSYTSLLIQKLNDLWEEKLEEEIEKNGRYDDGYEDGFAEGKIEGLAERNE